MTRVFVRRYRVTPGAWREAAARKLACNNVQDRVAADLARYRP
jgi:AraC-like DNA-binding protein